MDRGTSRSLREIAILGIALAILAGAASSAMAAGMPGHGAGPGAAFSVGNADSGTALPTGVMDPDHYRFIGGKVRGQGWSQEPSVGNADSGTALPIGVMDPDHYRFIGGKVRGQGSSPVRPVTTPNPGSGAVELGLIALLAGIALSVGLVTWTGTGRYGRLPARSAS